MSKKRGKGVFGGSSRAHILYIQSSVQLRLLGTHYRLRRLALSGINTKGEAAGRLPAAAARTAR